MEFANLNLSLVAPEITLLVLTSAILLIDLFVKDEGRALTHILSLLTLVVLTWMSLSDLASGVQGSAFDGMYVADSLAHVLKVFSYIAVGVTLIYGKGYAQDRGMLRGGELYVLSLLALLGQMVMISAGNMLTIYLGLELMSLAFYALVALRREHTVSTEAAMKYFVLGALASGLLLYGMSMIYGATGTLNLAGIARATSGATDNHMILVFGLVFLVAGLAFKLGVVPFHMWVPDVYQGAPTAVTLLLGGAPKLAAFAIVLRLLVDGLFGLAADWQPMLAIMAVLSLAIGNLAAIMQANIKRMLAYSTISHMGFVLLGLMSGVLEGSAFNAQNAYTSAMFYVVVYVLTTLSSFGVLMLLSRSGFECENVDDLKGLNRRNPWFAGVMLVQMFSLAGIPPTVGFYAKLAVLQSLIQTNHVVLAVVAVLFSLIGAFYYLRVVKVVYFDDPVDQAPLQGSAGFRAVLSVNGALLLILGVFPAPLVALCAQAISSSLAL
ncbi:NADH-quinone oxidoreductase subunit NuoN [Pigmentiphaga sp.]|uniref:NADH-quinone oxidoreductase subunit NuoN n=1 Tax=Pigmentiphaga sp. TaxID=1977564 RepID=UPI00128DE6B0|nr:NADH-quinone oxidoreductase subunit NuoN [Pigmentiphaga sp.]MPS28484.1 NADH-quinone oxidoreductase subunit NuoN [Alcaligenaceae bacterium SAGV5]MPS52149.1 NADH-quinone oxidoreductase subunit NuoN [Alcaligenaceae bacterium SAGV3]MPT56305.1 NADH-quinone oxidoreductase subunit NuoN [Alcaligenaceae bacterium]